MATVDVSRIGSNIGALNSLSALTSINNQLSVHQTRLATGKRINSAADDPAGLTIATKLNSRSEGLKIALGNIGDAKNLLAVAESGLSRVNDILVQMRNKSEQAASDTMGTNERAAIVTQLKAYAAQIDDIATQTEWNGKKLIDGSFNSTALTFQTGAGGGDVTTVKDLKNMGATGVANGGSLQIATLTAASSVTKTSDSGNILTGQAAGAADNSNLSLLSSGTYRVQLVSDGGAGADTLRLFDAGGTELMIAQTGIGGAGTGAVAKGYSANLAAGGAVNLGNGLTVTLAAAVGAGTYNAEVNFTATGDYDVTFDDGGGSLTLSGGSSAAHFNRYMSFIGQKLDSVSGQLSNIGALSGRLGFKEEQITASQINTEAAYNRIMNANMAEEQVNASKLQILQQTSTAMLAQANAAPQFLLSLFR
jgi:flagellin